MDYGLLKKHTRMLNVLFIEDDSDFREHMNELLLDIFPRVQLAENGEIGLIEYNNYYNSKNSYYDILITDIEMPILNGVKLVESIYEINPNQIIIILSARNEFNYLLPLVNIGVHLFLTKPIKYTDFLEKISKVSKFIYETNLDLEDQIIVIHENLNWNKETKMLSNNNKNVLLTKKEVLLITLLLTEANRTFTINEIILSLWNHNFSLEEDLRNLKNIISRLRKKVPDLQVISIYSVGYRIDI